MPTNSSSNSSSNRRRTATATMWPPITAVVGPQIESIESSDYLWISFILCRFRPPVCARQHAATFITAAAGIGAGSVWLWLWAGGWLQARQRGQRSEWVLASQPAQPAHLALQSRRERGARGICAKHERTPHSQRCGAVCTTQRKHSFCRRCSCSRCSCGWCWSRCYLVVKWLWPWQLLLQWQQHEHTHIHTQILHIHPP